MAYGVAFLVSNLVAGRLADYFHRVYQRLLMMAVGLWVAALCVAMAPILFENMPHFSAAVALNVLRAVGNGGQGALYVVSIANVVPQEDLAQVLITIETKIGCKKLTIVRLKIKFLQ